MPDKIKSRTRFHPWCLGSKNEVNNGRIFNTLSSITRELGHADTEQGVAMLKTDIEGYEFDVLWESAMPEPGQGGALPSQILVELHWNIMDENGFYAHHTGKRRRSTGELAMLSMAMHARGYRLLNREDNDMSGNWGAFGKEAHFGRHNEGGCGDATEVTFVRVMCDDGDGGAQTLARR